MIMHRSGRIQMGRRRGIIDANNDKEIGIERTVQHDHPHHNISYNDTAPASYQWPAAPRSTRQPLFAVSSQILLHPTHSDIAAMWHSAVSVDDYSSAIPKCVEWSGICELTAKRGCLVNRGAGGHRYGPETVSLWLIFWCEWSCWTVPSIPISLLLFASRIPLLRPIGISPDLCMIIERAMYTDDQSGTNNPNVFGSWPYG